MKKNVNAKSNGILLFEITGFVILLFIFFFSISHKDNPSSEYSRRKHSMRKVDLNNARKNVLLSLTEHDAYPR